MDLWADGKFEVIYAEKDEFPFVFKRGNLVIGINPSDKKASAALTEEAYIKKDDSKTKSLSKVYGIGDAELQSNTLVMQPQSFAVFVME